MYPQDVQYNTAVYFHYVSTTLTQIKKKKEGNYLYDMDDVSHVDEHEATDGFGL
jgi:hypothetical protein